MANGIDAAMEADQAADLQAVVDRLRGQPEPEQLVTRDHAMLLCCQARNVRITGVWHVDPHYWG